jgi:predicted NACHT family NTPase
VILGAPGSGKTTQALLLMRHLLDVARRDPSAPVPEVFQLASWARGRQPLLEWLTDQLQRRHGYRPSLGRSQLVHRHIIPVLDGLDEVASEHQPACAT